MKKKDNGKIASYSHISKFYDAIKYGSKVLGRHLFLELYAKTNKIFVLFQKRICPGKDAGKHRQEGGRCC